MSTSVGAPAPKRILLPIATGSEEIEATTIADVLVRAGAVVTVASAEDDLVVRMSRGLRIAADVRLSDMAEDGDAFDAIAIPGGMPGAERLRDSPQLEKLVRAAAADSSGPIIAAICAAPAVVLGHYGVLGERDATCYPAPRFVQMLDHLSEGSVVVSSDGRFITSRGPATAMAFALAIVERLYGKQLSEKLAKELLVTA